jgi:hypothetical protein
MSCQSFFLFSYTTLPTEEGRGLQGRVCEALLIRLLSGTYGQDSVFAVGGAHHT